MLEQCGKEQVVNAFDNTIVATDDFLARTIDWLEQERRRDPERDSALIYVSDHGESLGENGVYLHGLPKLLAPKAQTHVPMVLWSSRAENLAAWRAAQDKPITHDVLFHSMLGYFTLKPTRPDLYQSALDLFAYKP